MILSPQTSGDIRRYYEKTWVKFQEFGDKLFFIERVRDYEVVGIDEDGEAWVLYMEDAAPYVLNYNLPNRAIFPHGGSVLSLRRIPAKQYQRGLSTANTIIVDVFSGKKLESIKVDVLKSFVNKPIYTPLAEALDGKFPKRVIGVIVAHRISFNRNLQQFFVDAVPVAAYNRETATISVVPRASGFIPAFNGLVGDAGLKLSVKVMV